MAGFFKKLASALRLAKGAADGGEQDTRHTELGPEIEPIAFVVVVGTTVEFAEGADLALGLADQLKALLAELGTGDPVSVIRAQEPLFELGLDEDPNAAAAFQESLVEVFKREQAHAIISLAGRNPDGEYHFSSDTICYFPDYLSPIPGGHFKLGLPLEAGNARLLLAMLIAGWRFAIKGNWQLPFGLFETAIALFDAALVDPSTDYESWSRDYLTLNRSILALEVGRRQNPPERVEEAVEGLDTLLSSGFSSDNDYIRQLTELDLADGLEIVGQYRNDAALLERALGLTRIVYRGLLEEISTLERRHLEDLHKALLLNLGTRTNDEGLLREALEVSKTALAAIESEYEPLAWANGAFDQLTASLSLFEHTASRSLLSEAEAIAKAALELTHNHEAATATRYNLLTKLSYLYKSRQALTRDEADFHAALDVVEQAQALISREHNRDGWANLENQIGDLWVQIFNHSRDVAHLDKAIFHLERASEDLARASNPLLWADMHNSLGGLKSVRGLRPLKSEDLKAALRHYQLAMEVFTKDDHPSDWADLQARTGQILFEHGHLTNDGRDLLEAVRALTRARDATPESEAPRKRADIACQLAAVQIHRGDRFGDAGLYKAGLEHLEAALSWLTLQRDRDAWKRANTLKSHALQELAFLSGERNQLEVALTQTRALLEIELVDEDSNAGWRHGQLGDLLYAMARDGGQSALFEEAAEHFGRSRDLLTDIADAAHLKKLDAMTIQARNAHRAQR